MAEILDIKGVGPVLAKACIDKGFSSVGKIAAAMFTDLVVVPGVSETKAKLLIGSAQTLLSDQPATNGAAAPEQAAMPVTAESEDREEKKELTAKKSDKKKDKKKNKKKKSKKGKKSKKNKKGKSKK